MSLRPWQESLGKAMSLPFRMLTTPSDSLSTNKNCLICVDEHHDSCKFPYHTAIAIPINAPMS